MNRRVVAAISVLVVMLGVAACSRADLVGLIQAREHPSIEDVRYSDQFMDRDRLDVYLEPRALDSDARMVWCEVLLPMQIPEDIEVNVVTSSDLELPPPALFGVWDPPADCSDSTDVPAMQVMVLD